MPDILSEPQVHLHPDHFLFILTSLSPQNPTIVLQITLIILSINKTTHQFENYLNLEMSKLWPLNSEMRESKISCIVKFYSQQAYDTCVFIRSKLLCIS